MPWPASTFFDDRLNLYAHGEYDKGEEVTSMDIDWLRERHTCSAPMRTPRTPTTAALPLRRR
jgi:hypothetical protein